MKKVESSTIDSIHYDPETRRLDVLFKHGGLYHYDGVTPEAYEAFERADSLGKHLHKHIKGKFAHRKAEKKG